MKIGFCSIDGIKINEHFGKAEKIFVYDVNLHSAVFLEERKVEKADPNNEHLDSIDGKIEKIKDCKIIYFTQIGGPAAAKVIKNNIFPVNVRDGFPIEEAIGMLQKSFENPPLWIKKILREENEVK
ncbi:NifB/NifX family molybdenum-iron cluster-binding protein [Calditerrivibrio nitroreducens]|uniref:Dinitrogenase iron-molybdenum cofactor biosynthesis protein n=1 Tax=Calditerrivibrio nitroreducens (strain DSM 19672 / NBRC 101217 / Yu37-1) TaxID=768670 RepID=E4TG41_CALNY|nr:NifB/NifX family molybdenum-iron cluster-binding protein [Calditerrivibrio nitroreducens]ADR18591.1 Dinitrogenase iron-molybdenum cofactor biosynthesis protein [Calditerrivibrio nitroreducens DSM 19672]